MKRPLAYITAAWSGSEIENAETAARYCRQVYDAGYSPICPLLLTVRFLCLLTAFFLPPCSHSLIIRFLLPFGICLIPANHGPTA